ncbi:hypothetical protein GGX14DRAFT_406411 [Mycena pura]|uniref:PHD-type domain-containing protein n=1 Tax=Mycena pura TaxID=153505 RepID=A0AAD6URU1_9AGAR|nr:hypothetical protein GGX14DRAFT_406411 [Mycena pura]
MDSGGSASTADDLDTVWQKDTHTAGKATCPKCGELRSYGTAGILNLASAVRRSVRKRKARDDIAEISAALQNCLCGSSAAPADDSDYPNVAHCKNEGCETKWYHLACLERGSVPNNWVCEACLSGSDTVKRRRSGNSVNIWSNYSCGM